ncbi:MAG TPA: energy transducer TonB [Rhizomicrobium sp.]|jgi:protein TonB|nr:energy transducer TonB [Rhizomicrobium sp.]
MQQPEHDIRPFQAAQATPRRFMSVIVVGGIHLVLIWALATGLASNFMHKQLEDITTEVIKEKAPQQNKVPPPPPPELVKPPPPFVPPPDIVVTTEAPSTNTIVATTQHVEPKPQISSPAAIGRPHSCGRAQYPALAVRLDHEGNVGLNFTINTNGSVSNVSVSSSSGHDELDQAAVACASSWTYKPAIQNGAPVAVPWKTTVQWKLNGG